ncbi:hypothetical protein [Sorangium cellulosum]|nr:hypothetical protein [Sorangium cellulosum]
MNPRGSPGLRVMIVNDRARPCDVLVGKYPGERVLAFSARSGALTLQGSS